jgi:hypothetical protein
MILQHGKSGYTHGGCRCEVCTDANTAACLRRRRHRAERLASDPGLAPHGSSSTYRNWGCRCKPCKAASSAELAAYYLRAKSQQVTA